MQQAILAQLVQLDLWVRLLRVQPGRLPLQAQQVLLDRLALALPDQLVLLAVLALQDQRVLRALAQLAQPAQRVLLAALDLRVRRALLV